MPERRIEDMTDEEIAAVDEEIEEGQHPTETGRMIEYTDEQESDSDTD